MDFAHSPRALELIEKLRAFMREHLLPVESELLKARHEARRGGDWKQWIVEPEIKALKAKAREAGLWNFFLPDPALAPGLNHVEYAALAEEMGRSFLAPEIFNCNAPDTGNMEVLWKYGSPEQKERWMKPLLAGSIRSAFCMTEPDVASSDATNMQATATLDGDEVVLDGKKWWSSGIGHPDCRFAIFMGVTDAQAERHARHSMVIVPLDAPGVRIVRMLPVFNDYDEPYGHGEVHFDSVRVPQANVIAGLGRGFEIAQGRLGPGRIHHCMRCIGAAERALELLIDRGMERQAFGRRLIDLGGNQERIADLRIAIDQARLMTLYAAWMIDKVGALKALTEISAIKIVAPSVLQRVADEAMQMFGGAGLSNDSPLAAIFAHARVLRLADGPDSVHRAVIARREIGRRSKGGGSRIA